MPLNIDERELLRLIAEAPAPLALSDFCALLNPPSPELEELKEEHPDHPAWVER